MADINAAGDPAGGLEDSDGAEAHTGAETASVTPESSPESSSSTPTHVSAQRQNRRRLVHGAVLAVYGALLAPIALAALAALAAFVTDVVAALVIARLVVGGSFAQAGDPLNALSIASRVGLMTLGYLGLVFALMPLLAGLLGPGRGRLYIIPGALLTASALVLFGASIALCWPVLTLLAVPHAALLAIAIYLALDAVAVAFLLTDTRQWGRRWFRVGRSSGVTAPSARNDAPPVPPPTLAGA